MLFKLNFIGKFRREFRNVLERGHCLTLKQHQRHNYWQSQYRSRYANDDHEHTMIHSTTHMVHVTPSLRKNFNCVTVKKNINRVQLIEKVSFSPPPSNSKRVKHHLRTDMDTRAIIQLLVVVGMLEVHFKIASR